jgi:superfamily II DNA helicase RecQ
LTISIPQEIEQGDFQIVISSIEAFTDTSRLLPAVKSPILATRPQLIVVDEAHVITSWGEKFRPQYSVIGDLRLVTHSKTPYIAATATANADMRQSIKNSLSFREDSLTVNLGNYRHNIVHSVHRLKGGAASVIEILNYFPSKTELPGYCLVFVDSRPLGQAVLHLLRQHVVPALQPRIQIYHAHRGEYTKSILQAGFEKEEGFGVLICTEALTMVGQNTNKQ